MYFSTYMGSTVPIWRGLLRSVFHWAIRRRATDGWMDTKVDGLEPWLPAGETREKVQLIIRPEPLIASTPASGNGTRPFQLFCCRGLEFHPSIRPDCYWEAEEEIDYVTTNHHRDKR